MSNGTEPKPEDKKTLQFSIRKTDDLGEAVQFKVKTNTILGKVFAAYAEKLRLDLKKITFRMDGEVVMPHHTPQRLDLMTGTLPIAQSIRLEDSTRKTNRPTFYALIKLG